MSQYPESEPTPRPVLVPVIIAAVFLTIIGVSVGLALGAYSRSRPAAAPARPPAVPSPVAPEPSSAAPAPSAPAPPAEPCRPETVAAAGAGPLRLVVHRVYTASDVYICGDEQGRLYYHANRGAPGDRWVDGETALFLPGVEQQGPTYLARNKTSGGVFTFEVAPAELRIGRPGGATEVQRLRPAG